MSAYKDVKNRINKLNKRLLHARKVAGINSNTYQALANAMLHLEAEFTKEAIASGQGGLKATYLDIHGNVQISRANSVASQKFIEGLLDAVEAIGTVYTEVEVVKKELARQGKPITNKNVIDLLEEVNSSRDFFDDVWAAIYKLAPMDLQVRSFLNRVTGVPGDPAINTSEAIKIYNEHFKLADHNLKPIRNLEDKQMKSMQNHMIKATYQQAYDAYVDGDMDTFREKMRETVSWQWAMQTKTPPPGSPSNWLVPAIVSDEVLDDYINSLFEMQWDD